MKNFLIVYITERKTNFHATKMYFIFENNNFRTTPKGNRKTVKTINKKFDTYTITQNCFETQEIANNKFRLTQDGKDVLTKGGKVRTTKETNKTYAKLSEKFTLVRMASTHVEVKCTLNNQLIEVRPGKTAFKIGSYTLKKLLEKPILVATFVTDSTVSDSSVSDDQKQTKQTKERKRREKKTITQPIEVIAPIVETPEVAEVIEKKTIAHFEEVNEVIAPIVETPKVAEVITFVADNKTNEKEEGIYREVQPEYISKAERRRRKQRERQQNIVKAEPIRKERPRIEDVKLTTDKDKLKTVLKQCYIAHKAGRGKITFKMREIGNTNGNIRFYSLHLLCCLTNGKWDPRKAHININYWIQHPEYFKNEWTSTEAELYADRKVKNIGSNDVYSDSDTFIGMEMIDTMELDDIQNTDWSEFGEDIIEAMMNTTEPQQQVERELYAYERAGFDSLGDYIDSFGDIGSKNDKEQKKLRSLNVMKQINIEVTPENCFREALNHHGLESKITGLVSHDEVLNELERLQINYVIYNPTAKVLEKEYIMENLTNNNILMPTKASANAPKTIFTEINISPQIEYECHDYETKVYEFALCQNEGKGHIYVPQLNQYYTNGSRKNLYEISTYRKFSYMKIVGTALNRQKSNYIYYDIETVESTDERKFKCTSVSVLKYSCYHDLYKLEEKQLIEMLKNKRLTACYLQHGVNDTKEDIERRQSENLIIVDEINLWEIIHKALEPNAKNYIVSFNGACFDNLFLLKSIIENKVLCETSICGGLIEISSSRNSDMPTFRTIDIRRLTLGSLEGNSKTFITDVSMRKVSNKKLFPIMNEKYRNGKVLDDDEFIKEFIEYNNLDVESLMLIHCGLLKAFTIITKDENTESIFSRCISMAQYSYVIFQAGIKNLSPNKKPQKYPNVGKMKGLSEEDQKLQYDLLRTYKTGGRCQAQKTEVLESKFNQCSLDVASLYPFVMMCYNKGFYMSGKLKPTTTYVEGKPGVYFGTVTQNDNGNNEMGYFCEKSALANDWDVFGREITRAVMTSHDIEEILKKKPHWQFSISWGYYTEQNARGIDIFASILPFMKEKARQDLLAVNKDPSTNTAVREMCKSVMNSLSGKFLQTVKRVEKFVLEPEVLELLRQNGQEVKTAIGVERKDDDEYRIESLRKDKMLHVGLFIYSLSKIYMYQNAYSITNEEKTVIGKNEFVYTDTDSNKIVKQEVFDNWMELRGVKSMANQVWPECLEMNLGYTQNTTYFYNGTPGSIKCMGQFEDEYKGKGYNNAIYLSKKEYMVWKTVNGKITHSTIKLKGVQCTKLLLLNKESNDIGRDVSENKLMTINYTPFNEDGKKLQRVGIEEGYQMGSNGRWECQINQSIYHNDSKWWNDNNRITTEIEAIGEERTTDHDAYARKFIYIMKRKWHGEKTLVLIKNFKRDIYQQSIRNTFMIKRI